MNRNSRVFTKEAWDAVISSECNKCRAIPVISHINSEVLTATDIPLGNVIGMADCSWDHDDINVHMVLCNDMFKDIAFMPSFSAESDDIKYVDGTEVISKCDINCFFGTERPAIDVKKRG